MSLQNMPFTPARWFDNSGNALAGGFLWFYLRGTSTPATGSIWQDPDKIAAWSNPVQLDGSGHADIFLDPGAYTVVLKDYSGVQVSAPVDVIQAAGGFGGGDGGTARMVANYAAARALATAYDALYVLGRTTEGDGGEGWFQRIPGSVETDDDGAVLVAGTSRYKRLGMVALSPRWYGVIYGASVAQDASLAKVLDAAGTGKRGLPVLVDGSIYLGADTTVSAGVELQFTPAGKFVSGVGGVVLTFAAGSKIEGAPFQAFGSSVQPKFPAGTRNPRLSWMGGSTGDDRLTKLAACSTQGIVAVLDDSVSISTNITFPANLAVDVDGGLIAVTEHADIAIPSMIYRGLRQWISYASMSALGSVVVGAGPAAPEWFGAVADGVADDSLPLAAACASGWVKLRKPCKLAQAISFSGNVLIEADLKEPATTSETLPTGAPSAPPAPLLVIASAGALSTSSALIMRSLSISIAAGHAAGALTAGYLVVLQECYLAADANVSALGASKGYISDSALPWLSWNISTTALNRCRYTVSSPYGERIEYAWPQLTIPHMIGARLDDILSAAVLGTDAQGVIVGTQSPALVLPTIQASIAGVESRSSGAWTGSKSVCIADNSAGAISVALPAPPTGTATARLLRVTSLVGIGSGAPYKQVTVTGNFGALGSSLQLSSRGPTWPAWCDFVGFNGQWYPNDGGSL